MTPKVGIERGAFQTVFGASMGQVDFQDKSLKMESPQKVLPFRGLDGAQGRNRTTDTAIFSRMLYQLSYLGNVVTT